MDPISVLLRMAVHRDWLDVAPLKNVGVMPKRYLPIFDLRVFT